MHLVGKRKWVNLVAVCVLASFLIGEDKSADKKVPQEKVDKNGCVTRVYDVRDVIFRIDIPNFDSEPLGWFHAKAKDKPRKPEAQVVTMLINAIRDITAPEKWGAGTSISFLEGNLVITNKPQVHDQIARYISGIRDMLNLKIEINAQIFSVDFNTDRNIREIIKFDFSADKTGESKMALLSIEQFVKLIQAYRRSLSPKLMKLPKTTLHNGQRAYVSVCTSRMIELPLLKGSGDGNIYAEYTSGVVFGYDATVSEDREYVTLSFNGGAWNLVNASKDIVTSHSEVKTTVTVPSEGILVFRRPVESQKAEGVAVGDGGKLEVKETKIDSKKKKFYYFMIQPKIIQTKPVPEEELTNKKRTTAGSESNS